MRYSQAITQMLAIICMRSGLDHQTEPSPIGPAPGDAFANFAKRWINLSLLL